MMSCCCYHPLSHQIPFLQVLSKKRTGGAQETNSIVETTCCEFRMFHGMYADSHNIGSVNYRILLLCNWVTVLTGFGMDDTTCDCTTIRSLTQPVAWNWYINSRVCLPMVISYDSTYVPQVLCSETSIKCT